MGDLLEAREAQRLAHDLSLAFVPLVVADVAPAAAVEHLHVPWGHGGTLDGLLEHGRNVRRSLGAWRDVRRSPGAWEGL